MTKPQCPACRTPLQYCEEVKMTQTYEIADFDPGTREVQVGDALSDPIGDGDATDQFFWCPRCATDPKLTPRVEIADPRLRR